MRSRKSDKLETDRNEEEVKAVDKSSPKELDLKHVETTNEQINDVKQSRSFDIEAGLSPIASAKKAGERINLSGAPCWAPVTSIPPHQNLNTP